jgi:hypothetical protein
MYKCLILSRIPIQKLHNDLVYDPEILKFSVKEKGAAWKLREYTQVLNNNLDLILANLDKERAEESTSGGGGGPEAAANAAAAVAPPQDMDKDPSE